MSFLDAEDPASFQPFQPAQSRNDEPHEYEKQLASSMDEDSDDLHSANALESAADSENNSQSDLASLIRNTSRPDEQSSSMTDESHLSPRPNKYTGPPSTWRNWTAAERELVASQDQLIAKDLSVHLYNAKALKQRARERGARKKQFTDADDDFISGQEWMPSKSWTAWPLAPDIVPREDDHPQWAGKHFPRRDKNHPSSETQSPVLKDLLIAQVQKKANQRRLHRRRDESELDSEYGTEPASQSEDSTDSDGRNKLESVTMLDDDVAKDLLQPAVNHILTKLDHLLMGLHHARDAYMAIDDSPFESKNPTDDDESNRESNRSGQHKRKRSISRPQKNRSQPLDPSLASGSGPNISSDDRSTAKMICSRERSQSIARKDHRVQKRKVRCGLRDWSDVLGVAPMTGWDPKIVQNAAFRCSKLFGEGIVMRKLNEHGDDSNEIPILPDTPYPDSENSNDELTRKNRRSSSASAHVSHFRRFENDGAGWKLYCPITVCSRSTRGFSNNYALKRHLKHVHQGHAKQSDEEMIGGVHIDGFLQPIPAAEAWIRKSKARQRVDHANQLSQTSDVV